MRALGDLSTESLACFVIWASVAAARCSGSGSPLTPVSSRRCPLVVAQGVWFAADVGGRVRVADDDVALMPDGKLSAMLDNGPVVSHAGGHR